MTLEVSLTLTVMTGYVPHRVTISAASEMLLQLGNPVGGMYYSNNVPSTAMDPSNSGLTQILSWNLYVSLICEVGY